MQKRFPMLTLAVAGSVFASQFAVAQTPRAEGRQEARQERREGRAQQQNQAVQRQAQQLNNRAAYFGDSTWSQLDPWITRNRVPPAQRAAQAAGNAAGNAAGAAAGAAGRAANAAARATDRAADAANRTANRAAAAAGNAAASATAAGSANARFGYTNPNVANRKDAWFYDYYSYNPTFYSAGAANAKAYGSASRYYDANNDGIYDSLSTFRDSDSNGSFDVYDRLDFADAKNDKSEGPLSDGLNDANRHSVSGTVDAVKVAKVNGSENLVVKLATERRDTVTIVDLGAADTWKSDSVREGDKLSATGPIEQIGEKQIVMAETVSVANQKEVAVSRSGPRLQGLVVDVTQAEVKGTQHTMAVIESESSRQIVDLGPSNSLKMKVEPQTKIVVQGVPVQFRDYSVVLADRVDIDGQQIVIQR